MARANGEASGEPIGAVDRDNSSPAQEFGGKGGECFQIAALGFAVQGVEHECRLSTARRPANNRNLAQRELGVDVFQVVQPAPAYGNDVIHWYEL